MTVKEANKAIEGFISALIASGLKIDIQAPHSELGHLAAYGEHKYMRIPTLDKTIHFGMIGVKLSSRSNVWHWFKYQVGDYPYLAFDHSYSQSTGKTKGRKGWSYRGAMRQRVAAAIGIDPQIFYF